MFGVFDILFISLFIFVNVFFAFIGRKNSSDICEIVFGKKSKFSDFVIIITLSATMIEPTTVINNVQQINIKGLPIVIMSLFFYPAMYFIITFFLVPRIVVTEMAFSWYEYIGKIYGKTIRIIYAMCEIILSVGWVAELFFTVSVIIGICLNCDIVMAKIIGAFLALILTVYSSFGGLRAVTITDIYKISITPKSIHQ